MQVTRWGLEFRRVCFLSGGGTGFEAYPGELHSAVAVLHSFAEQVELVTVVAVGAEAVRGFFERAQHALLVARERGVGLRAALLNARMDATEIERGPADAWPERVGAAAVVAE